MAYELVIAEKPSVAKKVADALADGKPIKKAFKKVPYYEVTHGDRDLVITCAVGHLFGVREKDKKKGWSYPIFSTEWALSSDINKGAKFTKPYADAIKKLAKDADAFTVATDFDIEGEVIGYNAIKFLCKQKDASRMKFSTLTKPDLIKSYDEKMPTLEWGQVNAGVTRHEMDWLYGINLSRALTLSIKAATNSFKLLSSGRVQGPALKLLVDKEKEIGKFVPVPYWEIKAWTEKEERIIESIHQDEKFWEKDKASEAFEKIKGEKQAKVDEVKTRQFKANPPVPFDLTGLQLESHKTLRISPKRTLEFAQELYTGGYISYPRTSSQKLPKELGHKKILTALTKQEKFKEGANFVLKKTDLKPNEGKKTDAAHPAIYPTGVAPKIKDEKVLALYELITRRYMAVFGKAATRETMTIRLDIKGEIFKAKGTRTVEKGWFELYGRFVMLSEEELPAVEQGEMINIKELKMNDKETQPPKRFTPASIISELEKRNLGTKATRAQIIENLYSRGYVNEKSIQATELGIKTINVLEKYCPSILDDALTRHFEEEMEEIRNEKKTTDQVIQEVQDVLTKILDEFKKKEQNIGKELAKAMIETRNEMSYVGPCPKCEKGDLQIRKGRFGAFIACNKYPDCSTTFSLPAALVKPLRETCEHCALPRVKIIKKRSVQSICINPKCPSKLIQDKEKIIEMEKIEKGEIERQCPKCGKAKLKVRKSIYGAFLGCEGYPKCRFTEKIEEKEIPKEPEEKVE